MWTFLLNGSMSDCSWIFIGLKQKTCNTLNFMITVLLTVQKLHVLLWGSGLWYIFEKLGKYHVLNFKQITNFLQAKCKLLGSIMWAP